MKLWIIGLFIQLGSLTGFAQSETEDDRRTGRGVEAKQHLSALTTII